jgi:hypothetical protein
MAEPKIRIRRSATPNNIPTTGQLELGELAINTHDGQLFLKKNVSGTETIVQVGGAGQPLAGVDGQLFYNNNGFAGGTTNLYYEDINNRVGIGTTTPQFLTDVNGDLRIRSTNRMRFGGTSTTTNFFIQYNSTTNSLDFIAG